MLPKLSYLDGKGFPGRESHTGRFYELHLYSGEERRIYIIGGKIYKIIRCLQVNAHIGKKRKVTVFERVLMALRPQAGCSLNFKAGCKEQYLYDGVLFVRSATHLKFSQERAMLLVMPSWLHASMYISIGIRTQVIRYLFRAVCRRTSSLEPRSVYSHCSHTICVCMTGSIYPTSLEKPASSNAALPQTTGRNTQEHTSHWQVWTPGHPELSRIMCGQCI